MLLRMRGCVNEISVSRIRQSVTQLQNIISFLVPSIIKHTDNTYNNIHNIDVHNNTRSSRKFRLIATVTITTESNINIQYPRSPIVPRKSDIDR